MYVQMYKIFHLLSDILTSKLTQSHDPTKEDRKYYLFFKVWKKIFNPNHTLHINFLPLHATNNLHNL